MERMENTETTIEVFENDIDFYLKEFCEEQNIDDLRTVPQSVWNACLMYIQRHVFNNKDILKQHSNVYTENTIFNTNCNSYNYDLLYEILEHYIYITFLYGKECSINGFSKLLNIPLQTIMEWGNNYSNSNRLSTKSFDIYKKLTEEREESLSNKLADGKQNPVGVIAILNRQYGWASPYTADANRQRKALNDSELPKLAPITAEIRQIAQTENGVEIVENV